MLPINFCISLSKVSESLIHAHLPPRGRRGAESESSNTQTKRTLRGRIPPKSKDEGVILDDLDSDSSQEQGKKPNPTTDGTKKSRRIIEETPLINSELSKKRRADDIEVLKILAGNPEIEILPHDAGRNSTQSTNSNNLEHLQTTDQRTKEKSGASDEVNLGQHANKDLLYEIGEPDKIHSTHQYILRPRKIRRINSISGDEPSIEFNSKDTRDEDEDSGNETGAQIEDSRSKLKRKYREIILTGNKPATLKPNNSRPKIQSNNLNDWTASKTKTVEEHKVLRHRKTIARQKQKITDFMYSTSGSGTAEKVTGEMSRKLRGEFLGELKVAAYNTRSGIKRNIEAIITEGNWNAVDVIFVSDTGLDETNYMDAFIISECKKGGFSWIPAIEWDNKASHVAFIVRSNLRRADEILYPHGRVISLRLGNDTSEVNIMGIYQGFDTNTNKRIRHIMSEFVQSKENTIVLGDFNEVASARDHTANYIQNQRGTGELHKRLQELGMVDSCRTFEDLEICHSHVQETEAGKCFSRLDYIYTDLRLSSIITKYSTMYNSLCKSDHFPITIAIAAFIEKQPEKKGQIEWSINSTNNKKWNEWKIQVEEQARLLMKEIQIMDNQGEKVEEMTEKWTKIFVQAADKHLNKRQADFESVYTLRLREDEELQRLKEKERVKRHEYNTRLETNGTESRDAKKEVQKRTAEVCATVHEEEWSKLNRKIVENPSHIYKLLRKTGKKANRTSVRPHSIKHNGSITSNEKEVKEGFHRAWNKIYQSRGEGKEIPVWLKGITAQKFGKQLDKPITYNELAGKIEQLKKDKAAGNDRIHNEFLVNMPVTQGEILLTIMNNMVKKKTIPESWKIAPVAMLYKGKGEKSDPYNYRPITLLSCVYKVYSGIMTDRLNKWIEDNNILHNTQFGFRKGQDTSDAAARIFACISNSNSTNKILHMVLLDIAKAYDSVEIWAMKQTLEAYGLDDEDIKILMSMLEGNKSKLLTAFGPTEDIEIKSGVRQGDVISPILFSIFLDPLLRWLEKGTDPYRIGNNNFFGQAFADDTALLASSRKGIEERMKKVNSFMEYNNICINEDKSTYHWNRDQEAIITTRGRKLKYSGNNGMFTYLGWTTNLLMDWSVQTNILIKRFQQIIHLIMAEKKSK